MAGTALAAGQGFGAGEALRARRRTLRVGPERRTPGERDSHPPQAAGAVTAQASRHAPQFARPRSVAAADRGGEERSGALVWLRDDHSPGYNRDRHASFASLSR